MRNMKQLSTLVLAALGGYVQLTLGADAEYYACYSNQGSLQQKKEDSFQSRGLCRKTCVNDAESSGGPGYSVQAMTNGTICLCSQTLPNTIYKAADSDCKQGCPGFDKETCGSRLGTYFSVYLTGLDKSPSEDPAPSSSSSTSSKSTDPTPPPAAPPAPAAPAAPVTTATATATSKPEKTVNTASVAAGVVVGVLVIAGIGIGVFLFMKKRRRERVEEEYRKSAAAREFSRKPELDHRLDPVMIQRRDSVGSIADNQDYSRRILKVTNPDGN